MEVSRVGIDTRGIPSEAGQADDAVARRDGGGALAHGLDGAGKLEARDEGAWRRGRVDPQARGQIGEVVPDGAHGHAGVPGVGAPQVPPSAASTGAGTRPGVRATRLWLASIAPAAPGVRHRGHGAERPACLKSGHSRVTSPVAPRFYAGTEGGSERA